MPDTLTHSTLLDLSHRYLVIVLFVRSRSTVFEAALKIARHADLCIERDLESIQIFTAGFVPTLAGATRSLELIHYVRGWKGTHFYARGRMMIGEMSQAFLIEAVLKCFANSCAVRDHRAHCYRLLDDPFDPLATYRNLDFIAPGFRHVEAKSTDAEFIFPCRHLLQWFRPQRHHPSSIPDQIQAEGVEKLCDVCPRFEPDAFGVANIMKRKEAR